LLADHWSEDHEPAAFGKAKDGIDDLLGAAAKDGPAGGGIVRLTDRSVKDPKIIVDLRGGGHGAAGIRGRGSLFQRNGGRKAFDEIDIRLLHLVEELARIGRKALDVSALALGKKGVEGERRFAGSTDAGYHDQLVAWEFDRDIAEVVLSRTDDLDSLCRHIRQRSQVTIS